MKKTYQETLELNEKLYEAIKEGNIEAVKTLVESGADIHSDYLCRHNFRSNPMETVIDVNNIEILHYFLEKGLNFHIHNKSPLIIAIAKDHQEIIATLLAKSAQISYDALAQATHDNNYAAIESLLDYCSDNQRLVLIAMTENKKEMKEWLLNIISKRTLKNKLDTSLNDDLNTKSTNKIKI